MRAKCGSLALVLLAVLLFGCGDDDSSGKTATSSATVGQAPGGGASRAGGGAATVGATAPLTPSAAATPRSYTVQEGDTLGEIAVKFNTTVAALVAANNLVDP